MGDRVSGTDRTSSTITKNKITMGMFGSNWKEEETKEEVYRSITGHNFYGSESELQKEIERKLDDNWTSQSERSALMDLQAKMNNNQ